MTVCTTWALTLYCIAACAVTCHAADLHVPGDFDSIQAAIEASQEGDRVLVAPGTYIEHIDFLGRNIQVIGVQGAEVTAIDGSNTDTVVRFQRGETAAAVLSGFTLTRGAAPNNDAGGGVIVSNGAAPTIDHNIIRDNVTGGIVVYEAGGHIRNNRFMHNSSVFPGGGLYLDLASGTTVEDNAFVHNSAIEGGAIAAVGAQETLLTRNVIAHNSASSGAGGIFVWGGVVDVFDSLLHDNRAPRFSGGGLFFAVNAPTDHVRVVNNTLAYNIGEEMQAVIGDKGGAEVANNIIVNIAGPTSVDCTDDNNLRTRISHNLIFTTDHAKIGGNCHFEAFDLIKADPMFLGRSGPHAYWLSPGSPAIDAGDNEAAHGIHVDITGTQRIVNGTIDLGAYEFRGQ